MLFACHIYMPCILHNIGIDCIFVANTCTVYVPIDAHCASADLRVRVYLKKNKYFFIFFASTESTIIIWYIYLSIINCV